MAAWQSFLRFEIHVYKIVWKLFILNFWLIRLLFYNLSPGYIDIEIGFEMVAWQPFLKFEIHVYHTNSKTIHLVLLAYHTLLGYFFYDLKAGTNNF
jgi:hypothetical protein